MKQSQKLDALIKRILKEELDSRSKGVLDMEVSEDLLKVLSDFNRTDSPINLTALNAKKEPNGKYRIMIQSKTPEFKEFKKDFKQLAYEIPGDLEDEYEAVAKAIVQADAEGSVDLIKQGRKLGLEEKQSTIKKELDELTVPSKDGTIKGVTNTKSKSRAQAALRSGDVVDFVDPTKIQEKEEETQEPVMEQEPTGTDIAGQVAEIVEKLKIMSEGDKDPKKQKLASKVMKYMESAKAALEALTGHESMLEEKDQATKEKAAHGHLKAIEKHLGKIVRDKDAVGKMMKKMPIEKVIAMKQKMQSKEKELDEERVAKAMLKYSLQEGLVKKK